MPCIDGADRILTSDTMDIKQEQFENNGAFYIEEKNKRVAVMTYSRAGDSIIIIDHTEVDDKLHGKGAGLALVIAAVEFARKQNIKIIPLCPFANAVFTKRKAELGDVLN
jgi:uncharacterized protein